MASRFDRRVWSLYLPIQVIAIGSYLRPDLTGACRHVSLAWITILSLFPGFGPAVVMLNTKCTDGAIFTANHFEFAVCILLINCIMVALCCDIGPFAEASLTKMGSC